MHRIIKTFFLLTIFLLNAALLWAHGNLIKGKVTDASTGEWLAGASVVLNGDQGIVFTDKLGNFLFDNLADGAYTLVITFIGYEAQTIRVDLSSNETRVLDVALVPSTLRLDEVTITGTQSAEAAMTMINRIDIGLRPTKSAQDVLRMVPGLVTAQHAGGGKAEQIFLRGFDIDHGTDINLTVDGMPVNMVSHAHGQGYADLHFVTPEIIEFVDFNKGPYYSRVGDFNTAGYANFHTRNSIDKSSITLEAGRFDTYRAVALLDLLGDQVKNHNAYVAAEYLYTNGPFISPQHFNRLNLFAKYNGLIANDRILTVSLSSFRSEWDASGQIPERAVKAGLISRFGAIDDTEGGFTSRNNLNISTTKVYDNATSFRNQIYYSQYDFELYSNFTFFLNDPVNGDGIKQKESRNIYGYTGVFQKDIFLGKRNLRTEAGVGIRYDDVTNSELSHVKARSTFLDSLSFGDIDQINAHLYADATWNIAPRLVLNTGVRFDAFSFQYADKMVREYKRQSETASVVSPKLNLYFNIRPDVQLYLKNGFGFHSNDTRVVVARQAKDVLPRAFGTDLGIFAKPVKNMLLNFALWQMNLEQEFIYVGDEAVVEPSGETQRYGIDLSLRYQAADWLYVDLDGNYAHGRSVNDPERENYIPLAPVFTSMGGIMAVSKKGLQAGLRYRFVGDRPANEDNTVTAYGYFLVDGTITYTRPGFRINLTATNIFNREWNEAQFDTETRLKGEAEGISGLAFTPGDPFFIKAGITFFF